MFLSGGVQECQNGSPTHTQQQTRWLKRRARAFPSKLKTTYTYVYLSLPLILFRKLTFELCARLPVLIAFGHAQCALHAQALAKSPTLDLNFCSLQSFRSKRVSTPYTNNLSRLSCDVRYATLTLRSEIPVYSSIVDIYR